MAAGFAQIWSAPQLEQGAAGCPDFHSITGPNTHAIVISNDSECTLLYTSDVDPGLYVPPRTSLTIPCTVNMQYTIAVDDSSVATETPNQLVIVSETDDALAYSSLALPEPNLIQFIGQLEYDAVTPSRDIEIPSNFTAIIIVPVLLPSSGVLNVTGDQSGYKYVDFETVVGPRLIQLYPGLDQTYTIALSVSPISKLNIYGLTIPLTQIGSLVSVDVQNEPNVNINVPANGLLVVREDTIVASFTSSPNTALHVDIPVALFNTFYLYRIIGYAFANGTPVTPSTSAKSLTSNVSGLSGIGVYDVNGMTTFGATKTLFDIAFDPPVAGPGSSDATFDLVALGANIVSRLVVQYAIRQD